MNFLTYLFGSKESVDFKSLVASGARIVDVRSPVEYASGSASGSVNIPLDVLSLQIGALGDKDTKIITCCASGGRSAMAKNVLDAAGYTHVYNGGGWQALAAQLK